MTDFDYLLRPLACQDCGREPADHGLAHGYCGRCRRRRTQAGQPWPPVPQPRKQLQAGSWGYSAAYGTASGGAT